MRELLGGGGPEMRGGWSEELNCELSSSIARTFDKVGQNPWNDNLSEFERHLSELSEDSMYKALIAASQQAQELDPETTTVHEK